MHYSIILFLCFLAFGCESQELRTAVGVPLPVVEDALRMKAAA